MKPYIYIRVEVMPPDADRVALWQTLTEAATGNPVPDVIPHADPGGISFKHAFLFALDRDEAYSNGFDLLPPRKPGSVMNDYVVELPAMIPQ